MAGRTVRGWGLMLFLSLVAGMGCGGAGTTGTTGTTTTAGGTTCKNVGATSTTLFSLWTKLTPNAPLPPERLEHSAVYDATNDRMITFGGTITSGLSSDVWVLSNATGVGGTPAWTQLASTGTAPVPRSAHVAAYDSTNNRMMVFGGAIQNNLISMDLWVLTSANGLGGTPGWIQLSPIGTTTPSQRVRATAVYDAVNNKLILFGGLVCFTNQTTCNLFNEVWVLSNANGLGGAATWTKLTTSGTAVPSPRFRHTAVYDSTNNKMMIFGGNTSTATTSDPTASVNDVWVLSNANGSGATASTWTLLSVSGPPPARDTHTAIYDPGSNRLVIFAGVGQDNVVRKDVWILTNANGSGGTPTWAEYNTGSPVPQARFYHTAVYSATKNRMIIFGGGIGGSTLVNDAWVLRNANGIPTTPVSSITITAAATTICETKTLQLTAVAKDADGNTIEGVILIWISSDEPIATVDPYGLVEGMTPGTITIKVCSGSVCSPPLSITITPTPTTTPPPGGGVIGSQLRILPGQSMSACKERDSTRKDVVNVQTLMADGGSPLSGYTWTRSTGSAFPGGTTVDPLTGVFKASGGTLVGKGRYSFNMTVSDGSTTATGTITLEVEEGSVPDPDFPSVPPVPCGKGTFSFGTINPAALVGAKAGAAYGASLYAAGGTPPYSWFLGTGTLPGGLVIDQARGIVRGTPFSSAAGQTFTFTITIKDSTGATAGTAGLSHGYTIAVR